MAIKNYSTTPGDNTLISGIGIQGSNNVQNFDNGLRQLLADLAAMNAGTEPLQDTFKLENAADSTKQIQFSLSGITTATTRTVTFPDASFTLMNTGGMTGDGSGNLTVTSITADTYSGGLLGKAFRVTNSTNQSESTANTYHDVAFGTTTFDTTSGFSSPSFTVPASLNGAIMQFSVFLKTTTGEGLHVQIIRDAEVLTETNPDYVAPSETYFSSGFIQVSTGDVIKVQAKSTTAFEIATTHFSGAVII